MSPSPNALSRREFLGSAAILPWVPIPGRADETTFRAAVIGHTGRGDYGHGLEGIFKGRPGIDLVAVADPVEAGRTRMASAIGARTAYIDWREMLARERPALVSIAMRHADQHAEIALACLRAGAHVYIEKPFTRDAAEADEVLTEAGRRGLRVAVAHTMRLAPATRALRRALTEGAIGDLRAMRAHGKQDARAGGEELMVLGTHLFDLMRSVAGDPRWCSAAVLQGGRAAGFADRRQVKDEVGWVAGDQVDARFGFEHGVIGSFTSDGRLRETSGHWGIEFVGSRGTARLLCDLVPRAFLRTGSAGSPEGRGEDWRPLQTDGPEPTVPGPQAADHNRAPVTDWLEAVRLGREPECGGRNGAWAVEMAMAVHASSLARARVELPLTRRTHPLGGG